MAAILITDYLFTHLLFSIRCTGRQQLQQRFHQLLEHIRTNFPGYKCGYISVANLPTARVFINNSETLPDFCCPSEPKEDREKKAAIIKEAEKLESWAAAAPISDHEGTSCHGSSAAINL